jgi:hypothetical protein
MKATPKKLRLNQETIKNLMSESANGLPAVGSTPAFSCGGPHCELTNAINCFSRVCGQ